MKGKGLEFQDACIALKNQMVKGRIFRDNKRRLLTILEAPKGTAPIDVEVTTLSKKSRIRETKHLSTDADSSTDTTVGWTKNTQKPNFFEKRKKSSKTQKLKKV